MSGRRFRDRRVGSDSAQISTLPMIALFVILVTFLVAGASSVAISRIPVDVPIVGTATGGGESDEERYMLVVHILPDAFLIRDTETEGARARIERSGPGDLDALEEVLAGIRAERPQHRNVIFIPGPEISYDRVVEATDRARAAGLTHLSLASSSPGGVSPSSGSPSEAGESASEAEGG